MNFILSLKESILRHAFSLLAVVLIIALGVSYWLFYTSSIDPAISSRSILASQMTDAQKALGDLRKKQQDSPETLQVRLATAQSTLAASVNLFLTDSQANQMIDTLYQNASASGVTITELQSQNPISSPPTATPTSKPSPTPVPSPTQTGTVPSTPKPPSTFQPAPSPTASSEGKPIVYVTSVRLQAQGTSRQLVDFVSRLNGQLAKGFVINNIGLTGGDAIASLTMDISLYITSLDLQVPAAVQTPGAVPTLAATTMQPVEIPTPSAPQPLAPAASPIPPTLTPAPPGPKYIVYVVRPGDTLYSIARRYGITVAAIMAANRLPNFNIHVGQQLQIPVR
jgi:LysM repeat protein